MSGHEHYLMESGNRLRGCLRNIQLWSRSPSREMSGFRGRADSHHKDLERLQPRRSFKGRHEETALSASPCRASILGFTATSNGSRQSQEFQQTGQSRQESRMDKLFGELSTRRDERSCWWATDARRSESESETHAAASSGDSRPAWHCRSKETCRTVRREQVGNPVYPSGKALAVTRSSEWPEDLRVREMPVPSDLLREKR